MLHLAGAGPDAPRLPDYRFGALTQIGASVSAHLAAALTLAFVLEGPTHGGIDSRRSPAEQPCVDVAQIVFLAVDPRTGTGGGGGGGRSAGPIRRAESVGADAVTLRARAASSRIAGATPEAAHDVPIPSVVLDARPLASGTFEQLGLPTVNAPVSGSTGSGVGGGVGTGSGTGIGSGHGSGVGPGSGGGMGGGVFQPGGAVSAPRVIIEVKPKYTRDAMLRKVQGTVELAVVVTHDGRPSQIRIVRSIDPGGLDEEAVAAVAQWRFEPGRLAGAPVDVLVTVLLDFWIR